MRAEARTKSSAMSRAQTGRPRRHCTGTRVTKLASEHSLEVLAKQRDDMRRVGCVSKRNEMSRTRRSSRGAGMMSAAEISQAPHRNEAARDCRRRRRIKSFARNSRFRITRWTAQSMLSAMPRVASAAASRVSLLRHYRTDHPSAPPTNSAWKCKGNKREDGRRNSRGDTQRRRISDVTSRLERQESNRGSAHFASTACLFDTGVMMRELDSLDVDLLARLTLATAINSKDRNCVRIPIRANVCT